MAKEWTQKEKQYWKRLLHELYVVENLSLNQISNKLSIHEQTIYKRLKRLNFPSLRHLKKGYNNSTRKIVIPRTYNGDIAEFFGIMIGDGHVSPKQVIVTLGTKESEYADYVSGIIQKVFKITPSVFIRPSEDRSNKYRNVYFGSVPAVKWLLDEGLVHDKVKSQVNVPKWIFTSDDYMKRFIRGFFDTDGSVYKLRYGIQISLTNFSVPLLKSLQTTLNTLGYKPSRISVNKVYLTRVSDTKRFFEEISPKNPKHLRRYIDFVKCVGTQVVNED